MTLRTAAIAVIVSLVALGRGVAADDRKQAEEYFKAGEQAFRAQSFGAAAENFELAYKAAPLPEIAFSAAQSYRRQYFVENKPEYVKRAVELYRIYLDRVKTGGRVRDAADAIAEMQQLLDKLTAQGTKIENVQRAATRIAISVDGIEQVTATSELAALPVPDTQPLAVTLDGKPAPLFTPIEVSAGDHTVEIAAAGYFSDVAKRRVIEGTTELVVFRLRPKPAHLTIRTERGAAIALDGKRAGTAPLAALEVAAGTHTVTVTRRGRIPQHHTLDLAREQTRTFDVDLEPTGRRRVVPWIFVGAGAAALGAGVSGVVTLHYDNRMVELDDRRTTLGITPEQAVEYRHAVDRRDQLRRATWLLGGVAVIAGVTGLGLYWFDTPSTSMVRITPEVSAGAAQVSVTGRF